MFRIPFLSKITQEIQNYFNKPNNQTITDLPLGTKSGLTKYLLPDEEVLFTLKDFRAIYKAPRWLDSNTFFNSWFILTNKRTIIAKNSSSFKRFRDIHHNKISQIEYETGLLESRLIIHTPRTVDIIEFIGEAKKCSEGIDQKMNRVIENVISDTVYCLKCETEMPKGSKFCLECGEKIL